MRDIAPELWEEIKKQFLKDVENDEKIETIIKRMTDGFATHFDTQEYAIQIGEHASDSLTDVLTADVLPDGKMHYNIAERTVRPQMELVREMVLETAGEIQEGLNWQAGLQMKGIKPEPNDDRIEGIINRLCSEENYDKIKWILDAPIKAYSQSVVDDYIRANADFQSKAGLNPKIVRTLRGKGCKWCRKLAGTYDYADVSDTGNDVFRRHDNCKCMVTYDPGDGRIQDVHSKSWYDRFGNALLKTGGMPPDEYAYAKIMWNKVRELDLPQSEREHIYEELDNNLTREEKESAIVSRPIGNFRYTAVHIGHNQYKIYQKEPIKGIYDSWFDDVFYEEFGNDYE